ncbi:right-handed parallel beta-helix repeat-containing protein [Actinoalloteichus hymeniacidonis]|uniref:Right handed beta helix domain-containing protein n=1 Tax=Actinoalloteichus hymeniacidonis TaxID=340345 RepID=A0AAC9MWF9_9PSEU|nr:right-handed parallel beta-helix repeat-containing protein [Actinoalloteichus hymeniacidonis]AOS61021.1 hypothetical protein TL08_00885 [Actinoalloteichus hymeniacidonis]MBB5910979.1 hypothetical protein [Actinoalloteichus hymeniacidonis]
MTELFVCPTGDDSAPGSADRPFATLRRAQQAAREADGEVLVQLRAGTHLLTETLEFTERDSAAKGSRISYQAYGFGTDEQELVEVSGGRRITDWQVRDGIWSADVGELDFRQLSVDGKRVERAGIEAIPGSTRRTDTGYVTDSAEPLQWRAPGVELVFRGVYPWTEARCAVAEIVQDGENTEIRMAQPAFSWGTDLYRSAWEGEQMTGLPLPSRVENDPAFLTEPGTFALDRSRPGRHVLNYLPRAGEDPQRTRVVVPVLEKLIHATGTRDVSFRGLVFADATWLRPGGDLGFLHYHANGYHDGGALDTVVVIEDQAWVTVPTEAKTMPACLSFAETSGIRFDRCRFTRLGAAGLGVLGGADLTVRGCDFDTLAGSAISVDGGTHTVIEDNRVQRIGLDYSGSPGIALSNTVDCTVAHNEVSDVPHCGITAGPGRGTRILRNLTTDTMGVLADGGGIYLSGPQGDRADNGAVIAGNVIIDTRTPYNFGLYTDYGAAWVTVEGNVVQRADSTAVLLVSPPLEHVTYRGNFWDADPIGSQEIPDGVDYLDNRTVTDETEFEAATARIRARAGLLRDTAD